MIGYAALGVDAAQSRARIDAFVADAGAIWQTISTEEALGTTGHKRVADVVRRTRTRSSVVLLATLGVGTARSRVARTTFGFNFDWFDCKETTRHVTHIFGALATS